MIHSLLMQDRKCRYTHIHGCDNSLVIIQFDKLSCCHHFQGLGCVGFLFSIPQHLFERSSEWNFKDFWLQTGVNSNPPSLHVSFFPSFFLFFCRLFWKLLIFVSVNPTFLQPVYSFVGFVFFVSLAHTQWSGGLFFEPLSFVLQSSLWWVWVRVFVVFARFCFGSRVKFLAALVASQFLFHHN